MSRILALLLAFVFCTYATHARADVRLTDAQMDEVTAGIMVITNGPQLSAMVPSVYFSTALMRNNWDVKLTLANNGFRTYSGASISHRSISCRRIRRSSARQATPIHGMAIAHISADGRVKMV